MQSPHIAHIYSTEVMSFTFKNDKARLEIPAPLAPEEADKTAARLLRLAEKSGQGKAVLFGLGSGDLAARMAENLPANVTLLICEFNPALVRELAAQGKLGWWTESGPVQIVTDTSSWSILHLLAMSGVGPRTSALVNPELTPELKAPHHDLQNLIRKSRLKTAQNSPLLGHYATQTPSVSAAAILSPHEPNLDEYFSQFPDWLEEIVVVWDAEKVPDREFKSAIPIRHLAHPLSGDFGTQRNRMLAACKGDWVLYLDADETLSNDFWNMMPGLFAVKNVVGYYFPRRTFYPDKDNFRVGLGLWPDLQMRLFKVTEDLCFANPVHERLAGIEGVTGIVLDGSILHHTHLQKSDAQLREKLSGFDQAGKGNISHTLSKEYPSIPLAALPEADQLWNELKILLLPDYTA